MNTLRNKSNSLSSFFEGIVYLLPSLTLFAIFVFYPFIRTIIQSLFLSDNRGNLTVFVALENYISIFTSSGYLNTIRNTFVFTILTVPPTVVLALLLAVLTNENLNGMAIYKSIFTATMGISVAAGSVFWNFIFHPTMGTLNNILKIFSVAPKNWLADPKLAMFSVAAVYIWMNLTKEGLQGKHLRDFLPTMEHLKEMYNLINSKGFFRDLKIMEHNTRDILEEINKSYDVYICTAAMEVPNSFEDKFLWLRDELLFLKVENFVFCGNKKTMNCDILVDYTPLQLQRFTGTGVLFTSPFNLNDEVLYRVNNWDEIAELLL